MTSAIFEKLLNLWDDELRKKKKILLLVGNCPAHPSLKLKFINIVFLPPNTTAVLLPMDQGVIKILKARYQLSIIQDIQNQIEMFMHLYNNKSSN